ncbi:helix-turn-helix domain-containing protein [Mycobacterium intracellulare subsp. chimaera]|nr:helix-turn-helix domain-containing protein [Mycobacterium intracellulare subsp. chimaera]
MPGNPIYDCRYDTAVRPLMPGNPISRRALLAVAAARAGYADYGTGRNCRPSNERLAADTGYSEVLRGRQRTRMERLASWRVGDRGRGWASVWALHDNRQLTGLVSGLSPHPRSGPVRDKHSPNQVVTTGTGGPAGRRQSPNQVVTTPDAGGAGRRQGGAPRRRAPDAGGAHSAAAWRADSHAPAAHGWSPRDLNALIGDWAGVSGRRIPDAPHKPIGLLGAMLAWHGRERLEERPAALDEAREAVERAAEEAHLAAHEAREAVERAAHAAGRAALGSAGHTAARAIAAEAARAAARKRARAAAHDAARVAAAAAAARTPPLRSEPRG